jgi:hypothetical protein
MFERYFDDIVDREDYINLNELIKWTDRYIQQNTLKTPVIDRNSDLKEEL